MHIETLAVTAGPASRARGRAWHLAWFVAVSLLAFLLPLTLTSIWSLHHDVYYLFYFAATLGALALYVRWSGIDPWERLRSRWRSSLALGLAATAFVVWSVLAHVEATSRPTGWYFVFETVWRGLAYGVVDALLLSAFPALVAVALMRGRIDGLKRRLAFAALSLVLITSITVSYHVGYADFRGREVLGPVIGNAVISVPVIATANPLGSIVAHAAMHVAAVTHAYESKDRLPPQVSAGPLEVTMSYPSAFETPEGEAAFLAAYEAALKRWPVPYDELEVAGPFGTTHVVVAGPLDAPPIVLLHGYMATSAMWAPNVADFSRDHRVYAIDVMGQPSRSIPGEPIRSEADFVAWLTATLDSLHVDRVSLIGMSFGGWLALRYAADAPERVDSLVLLSAGGLLPMAKPFILRGMLMAFVPTRFTVNAFMHWAGFEVDAVRPVLEVMYLGLKHFRMPAETVRIPATPLSDDELRGLRMPVLLLMGDREVICNPTEAVARARRLILHFEGDVVPGCSHDMHLSQRRLVDGRVREFLTQTPEPARN